MDSLRRPEMIMVIIAIIAIIALAVYFYRRASAFQEEINKQGERFSAVVKKVSEMPQNTHFGQVVERIKQQDSLISEQAKTIESLTDEIDDLKFVIEKLNAPMQELGYKIEFPQRKKHKKKSKKTKKERRRRRYQTESEESSSSSCESEPEPPKSRKKKEETHVVNEDDDALERKIAAARSAKK
jgi:uncharacterized protein YoxC